LHGGCPAWQTLAAGLGHTWRHHLIGKLWAVGIACYRPTRAADQAGPEGESDGRHHATSTAPLLVRQYDVERDTGPGRLARVRLARGGGAGRRTSVVAGPCSPRRGAPWAARVAVAEHAARTRSGDSGRGHRPLVVHRDRVRR